MVELRDHGLHGQHGPRDLASLTSPEIQQAALRTRAKIQRDFDQLPNANPKYRDERLRLLRERVATEYFRNILGIRDATSHDDLELLRDTLIDRLNRGMNLASNPTRDRLFLRLLSEYQIVEDALSENCLWRWQDRLTELEAILNG